MKIFLYRVKKFIRRWRERVQNFGDKLADLLAKWAGSWTYIITGMLLLVSWIALPLVMEFSSWDPYPFILLNLALSFTAAFMMPIIIMSQNRQEKRDRAKIDFNIELNKMQTETLEEVTQATESIGRTVAFVKKRMQAKDKLKKEVWDELRIQIDRMEDMMKILLEKDGESNG